MSVVLDASALIAMIAGGRGADRVAGVIGTARISAATLAEVVGHFVAAGMPGAEVEAMLAPLPVTVVPVDRTLAHAAGVLRGVPAAAGLGVGDRSCLALARRDGLPAWTGDPRWAALAEPVGVEVVVVR